MKEGSPFDLANHDVFVITAAHQGREGGHVATWLVPGSLIPDQPRVVVAFSPMNATFELIWQSRRFAVSLLSEDQLQLLPHFGLKSGRTTDKLAGLALRRTASGLPVLEGCCGYADCQIISSIDAGDRMICLADIIEQQVDRRCRPLRLRDALLRLSPELRAALLEKRARDGERDRALRKQPAD